jgi:hypothetical protein
MIPAEEPKRWEHVQDGRVRAWHLEMTTVEHPPLRPMDFENMPPLVVRGSVSVRFANPRLFRRMQDQAWHMAQRCARHLMSRRAFRRWRGRRRARR